MAKACHNAKGVKKGAGCYKKYGKVKKNAKTCAALAKCAWTDIKPR